MTRLWGAPSDYFAGQRVFIVGGGPSLRDLDPSVLRGKRVIAVNNAGLDLVPWADVLMWSDPRWYRWNVQRLHRHRGALRVFRCKPEFGGPVGVRHMRRDADMDLSDIPNTLAGYDTGGGAINLAYLMGSRDIVLLGFDMNDPKPEHWHDGNYHSDHREPPPSGQRTRCFVPSHERMARALAERGCTVRNATPGTALTAYPLVSLDDVINTTDHQPLTVACVLKSGGIYNARWVERLRNGVRKHLEVPHRFVCLTDTVDAVEAAGIDAIPLTEDWPGWWSKLELFKPGNISGPVLYLDLDSIVVGSLKDIANYPHAFTMAHDWNHGCACSTAMAWNGDYSFIYEAFAADPQGTSEKYDKHLRPRVGDQAFIEDQLHAHGHPIPFFRDVISPQSIASYKSDNCTIAPPRSAAVVAFHGRPKPHTIASGWVAKLWNEVSTMPKSKRTRPGHKRRGDEILSRLPSGPVKGVEVGVHVGQLSAYLLERRNDLTLGMVDNWAPAEAQPEYYRATRDYRAFDDAEVCATREAEARAVQEQYKDRARIIKADSVEAAHEFLDGSLDFVFIDADHSYEGVRRDIAAWARKVRPGGWLSGHDYYSTWGGADFSGVDRAVDEWAAEFGRLVVTGDNDTWFAQIDAPECTGRTALIVGGAWCVHDDVVAAQSMFTPDMIIAINDIGGLLQRVDHWVSMHPDKLLTEWVSQRSRRGFAPAGRYWTAEHLSAPSYFRRVVNPGGGSAGLAVEVARALGAERIVLAGCPLESAPHFFGDKPWSPREVEHYRRSWARQKKTWGPFVRSMSGWTRDLYGAPDAEWLTNPKDMAA